PIGCAVDFVCRLLHLKIISLKNPLQIGLCNKAYYEYFIVTEQMIKDEPKEQMQYTVLVEKVMNSYVYWSVSTVK
ncbi:hypothetical protein ACG908_12430, partial [Acinetobacter johnsonii]